jgi:hypothetical protein
MASEQKTKLPTENVTLSSHINVQWFTVSNICLYSSDFTSTQSSWHTVAKTIKFSYTVCSRETPKCDGQLVVRYRWNLVTWNNRPAVAASDNRWIWSICEILNGWRKLRCSEICLPHCILVHQKTHIPLMHLDICSDKPVVRNHLTYDTAFHMPFINIPQGTKFMSEASCCRKAKTVQKSTRHRKF